MKDTWTVQLHTVTPMFLAGADGKKAEVRIPSIKGALRFWYRAVDPDYQQHEGACFGSGGQNGGQSRFLMRLETRPSDQTNTWSKRCYLSFSLKGRKYILPEESIRITILRRSRVGSKDREWDWKRLQAAVWLMGHIGGLGARSRRGFGSLTFNPINWKESDRDVPIVPIAHGERTPQAWMEGFQRGLNQIRSWFPGNPTLDHTVIDDNCTFHLHPEGHSTWEQAIHALGADLQSFRQWSKEREGAAWRWFDSAAMGLPLMIPKKWTFVPRGFQRNASPVWMRVIPIGGEYYPFIAVLSTFSSLTVIRKGKKEDGRPFSVEIQETLERFREFLWKERGYGREGTG